MAHSMMRQTQSSTRGSISARSASSKTTSRCNCTCVRAATPQQHQQVPAVDAAATTTSSNSSRRNLLLGLSGAAALTASQLLLLQPAPAAADEGFTSVIGDDEPETTSAAPDAAATPPAPAAVEQPAATPGSSGRLSQVTTPEGEIRLRTNDEATRSMTPTDRQIFTLNRRVQAQNRAPDDFPGFIREGFDITVVGEGYTLDSNGLIYKDFLEGVGTSPVDGQQVIFDYTGYNESGTPIDSSYRKGRAAEVRLGINGLIPGFELGIKGMKPGGKRRIVVPPALGPPVGPSTFFSAKQCEVFDVELRQVKTCSRRQMAMFSDVVCE